MKTLMTKRAAAMTVAAAAALGAAFVPAATAAASAKTPATQTIRGHLIESSDFGWATGYVSIDKDFRPNGTRLASDMTTCRAANTAAPAARCDAAIGLRKGMITITFLETGSPAPVHGQVTGGTGAYAGAKGSVTIVEGHNSKGPSTADWTIQLTR